jgi:hypothetical protein
VYEPVVIVGSIGHRQTSRAAEPDLPYIEGAQFHRDCHVQQQADEPPPERLA